MTSISELFPKCRKLAYDARQQLSYVQQQQSQNPSNNTTTTNQNKSGISELFIILDNLDIQLQCMNELVLRETPEQRSVWQRKIYELRQDYTIVKNQGSIIQQQIHVHYQKNRNQNNNNNNNTYQSNHNELMSMRRRNKNNNNNDINNLINESTSLEQSQYMVQNVIEQGQVSYEELIMQRKRLTGITGVVLDISNRLGLTQQTMKIIQRRDKTDAYFVIGGAIITLLVLYFTWFY